MSEERQYGLEDGFADAERGKAPEVDLALRDGSDYEMAYVEGYQRAAAELAEAQANAAGDEDRNR